MPQSFSQVVLHIVFSTKFRHPWLKAPLRAQLHAYISWQRGYASLSAYDLDILLDYIDGQEERHRTVSFQDEYRQLLKDHGIEFDERYMWD